MDALTRLKGFYARAEDSFYAFAGSLEARGLPAIRFFVEPIEKAGLPSFPIAILLLLLVAGGIGFVAFGSGAQETLSVRVYADNAALAGVKITIYDAGSVTVAEALTDNRGAAEFTGLNPQTDYQVKASKEGYGVATERVRLSERASLRFDLSKGGLVLPSPTPAAGAYSYGDAHAEDDHGKLSVRVKEKGGGAVDATVRVFSSESRVLLAEIEAKALLGGFAIVESLPVDSVVFATASSDGFLPFDGSAKTVEIKTGTNSYEIELEPTTGGNATSGNATGGNATYGNATGGNASGSNITAGGWGRSAVSVHGENGALSGAKVSVYSLTASGAVLLVEKTTNSTGVVYFDLNASTGYFASASKTGYHSNYSNVFQAGDSASLEIAKSSANNSAVLTLNVESEYGEAVEEASVQPFGLTSFGYAYALAPTKETDEDGFVDFGGLPRGLVVRVNATVGGGTGSSTVTLADENNTAQIILYWEDAFIEASAANLLTNESVSASFTASWEGGSSSCSGTECTLVVKPRKPLNITANANGFESFEGIENLEPNETIAVTYYLYPSNALEGSALVFLKATSTQALHYGETVSSLKLGGVYTVYYNFYAADADLRGAYFRAGGDAGANGDALITGRHPPAAVEYAGTAACDASEYETGEEYAWLDLGYAANAPALLAVNITIDENAELDEYTHESELVFFARSYLKQGANWLRSPFDPTLAADADAPLESGCSSPANNESFTILSPKTTCSNGACVTLEFQQGGGSLVGEGFEAETMLGVSAQDEGFEPLLMHYSVELFKDLGDASALSFNSLAANTEVIAVTVPNADCSGEETIELNGGAFALDVSRLKACPNYHPYAPETYPENFVFSGVIYTRPLAPVEQTPVVLEFETASVKSRHDSWYSITEGGSGEGEYASVALEGFSQKDALGYEVIKSQSLPRVYPLNDCTNEDVSAGECHHGFLSFEFTVSVEKGREQNAIDLNVDPRLEIVSAQYRLPGDEGWRVALVSGNAVTLVPGAFEDNDNVQGKIIAKPALFDGDGLSAYAAVSLKHTATDELGAHETSVEASVMIASTPGDIEGVWQGYFLEGEDNCLGHVNTTFDPSLPAGGRLRFQGGCTDLGLRVTSFYPVDAVATEVHSNGQALAAKVAEGSLGEFDYDAAGCFESCERDPATNEVGYCMQGFAAALTEEGYWTLRYNTELDSCPDSYRTVGDRINGGFIKFTVWAVGDDENAGINFTAHINAESTTGSLMIYPVLTSYKQTGGNDYGLFGPQVWVIANHKQYGTRTLYLVDASEGTGFSDEGMSNWKIMEFDGPGVKTFAFAPAPGRRLVVLEKLANTHGVYDSALTSQEAAQQGLLTNVSDYATAKVVLARALAGLENCPSQNPYCIQLQEYYDALTAALAEVTQGNQPYDTEVAGLLIENARFLANYTMFWRSNAQSLYCQSYEGENYFTPEAGDYVDCSQSWGATNPYCCRHSIDEWRNVTTEYQFEETSCAYCNNSYNPDCNDGSETHLSQYLGCTYDAGLSCGQTGATPSCYDCDQRCMHLAEGEGQALVEYGSTFKDGSGAGVCKGPIGPGVNVTNPAFCTASDPYCALLWEDGSPLCFDDANGNNLYDYGEDEEVIGKAYPLLSQDYYCLSGVLATTAYCEIPCTSWCFSAATEANCDLSCDATGTNLSITGSYETQTSWLNASPLTLVTFAPDPLTQAQEYQANLLMPARFYDDEPAFGYEFVLNTFGFTADAASAPFYNAEIAVQEVTGCEPSSQNLYDQQGLYALRVSNNPDIGTGEDLWSGSAESLKLAKTDYVGYPCYKGDAWSEVELCAPIWADYSTDYGACVNTVFLFEDNKDAKPFSSLPPGGRIVSGGVADKNYWISQAGYVVRLIRSQKIPKDLAPDGWRQEFEWWHPDGAYGGTSLLEWQPDAWDYVSFYALPVAAGVLMCLVPALATGGLFGEMIIGGGITFGVGELAVVAAAGVLQAILNHNLDNWPNIKTALVLGIIPAAFHTIDDCSDERIAIDPAEADIRVIGCRGGNYYNIEEK
ncbi:MAG: carboxypeptidase-like regulatory domain-containing protein [Candidatus Micrarchaeia archaeon]